MNGEHTRKGAGMFGYTHLYGGYPGGQAEFVRVPHADVGPLVVPQGIPDEKLLLLSDILPTAYQAVSTARVQQGSTVAVFGAGPVGLLAMACAKMMGAARIFAIDHHPYRLQFAAKAYGAEPINFDDVDDPAEAILHATSGRGVDAAVDAVGFEAKGSAVDSVLTALKVEPSSGAVLRQAIACTRRGGNVSIPGVYTGYVHAFMLGDAFEKGLNFTMGQTNVQGHMSMLLKHILDGHIDPSIIITHPMTLEQAALGYSMFDKKEDDCRKVVLTPSRT